MEFSVVTIRAFSLPLPQIKCEDYWIICEDFLSRVQQGGTKKKKKSSIILERRLGFFFFVMLLCFDIFAVWPLTRARLCGARLIFPEIRKKEKKRKKNTLTADWQIKLAADALKSLTFLTTRRSICPQSAPATYNFFHRLQAKSPSGGGTLAKRRAEYYISTVGVWAGWSVAWCGVFNCAQLRLDRFGFRLSLSGFG